MAAQQVPAVGASGRDSWWANAWISPSVAPLAPLPCSTDPNTGLFTVGSYVRVRAVIPMSGSKDEQVSRAMVSCVEEDSTGSCTGGAGGIAYEVTLFRQQSQSQDEEDIDIVVPGANVSALEAFEITSHAYTLTRQRQVGQVSQGVPRMPRMNAAAWRKESVHRLIDSSSLKAQGNTLYTLGDLAAAEERWTAAVEACSGLWANPITPMASVVLRDADRRAAASAPGSSAL